MDVLYWVESPGVLFIAWLLIHCWRDLASEARRPGKRARGHPSQPHSR